MKLGNGINFKLKSSYYRNIIGLCIFVLIFTWLVYRTLIHSEQELFDLYMNRGLIGRSRQRMSIGIQKFIVSNWGKQGLVITYGIITLGTYYLFVKEIFEFRRFLKKEKLFKQGLVDNMFDDHKPRSIFQLIKGIFNKTDEGKPKRRFKDIGKLQKDLERDKLYQKLYGKK